MPNPKHKPWTEEETEGLRQAYSTWPIRKDLLPERSKWSIYNRAMELGLTRRRTAPVVLDLTDTEWAYLAGIVDGEGSISKLTSARNHQACISIANTNKDLIDWLMDRVPGGCCSFRSMEMLNRRRTNVRHTKPAWAVLYGRNDLVAYLLKGMMPYLIIKREKAQWTLEQIPLPSS